MSRFFFALIPLLFAPNLFAQGFAPDKSCLAYKADKTMFYFRDVTVWGTSCQVEAKVEAVAGGYVAKVALPVASLVTDSERRDSDLRENYFFVAKYPFFRFESNLITKEELAQAKAGGEWNLAGTLTVMETQSTVTFALKIAEGRLVGSSKDQMSRLGVKPPKIAGGAFVAVHEAMGIHVDLRLADIVGAAEALR